MSEWNLDVRFLNRRDKIYFNGTQMTETEENKALLELIKRHSTQFLEMAFRADFRDQINRPDGYGLSSNECGDNVGFSLAVKKDKIQSIFLEVSGCINTNACANTVAFMAEGKTVSQAWRITPKEVSDYLETLPSHEFHCAEMAVSALRKALVKFLEIKQAPWKKMYS